MNDEFTAAIVCLLITFAVIAFCLAIKAEGKTLIRFRRLHSDRWEIAFNEEHLAAKLGGDMAEVIMPAKPWHIRLGRKLFPPTAIERFPDEDSAKAFAEGQIEPRLIVECDATQAADAFAAVTGVIQESPAAATEAPAITFDCLKDCPIPGYCCRGFYTGLDRETTEKHFADNGWEQFSIIGEGELGTPIVACSWIGTDGRCRDYENRPYFCRHFKPLVNGLCAAFVGPLNRDAVFCNSIVTEHFAKRAISDCLNRNELGENWIPVKGVEDIHPVTINWDHLPKITTRQQEAP